MSVIDIVRNWSNKKKEKSERFKALQEEDRLNTILNERKKSANRRELERYYKEEEEKQIKMQLDKIRKIKNRNSFKSSMGDKGFSILKEDKPILKQKNIFKDNPNIFTGGKKMFKW